MFKKIFALLLSAVLLLPTVLSAAALSQSKPTLSDVYLYESNVDADQAEINGVVFELADPSDISVTVIVDCSGIDYQNNVLTLDGKRLGILKDGKNEFDIKLSDINANSELAVVLYTGSPDSTDEAEKKVYGTYNIDDMVVNAVSVTMGENTFSPSGVKKYMPIQGSAGSTVTEAAYTSDISVGDGWNASTNLGGSTPQTPVKLGYVFKGAKFDVFAFNIDTTVFKDGDYEIVLKKSGNVVGNIPVAIDNTPPSITVATADGVISYSAIDRSKCVSKAWIDGEETHRTSFEYADFTVGDHCLYVTAEDSCGNISSKTYIFTVTSDDVNTKGELSYYTADRAIKINAYGNRLGELGMTSLRSESEVLIPLTGTVTESVDGSVPYQSFVIEVGDSEQAIITYTGETNDGNGIQLSVYDYALSQWVPIGIAQSGKEASFIITIKDRVQDGKIRVKAAPYTVGNGSDTVAWISDTQYMTSFEDLNYLYEGAVNYCKSQYQSGDLAYVLHTGDLVDSTIYGDDLANKEYTIASNMQKILDDAGVPNGVVSGNHDVCHKNADYKFFAKYFGAERYLGKQWYGGQIKNNTSHYDLITVGGYDFIFLFLGCYDEAGDDVISWADAVLKKYGNRNAVICTHEYLKPSGQFSGDRAQVIWDKLVVPNENVKMILCGHNDGVCNQWRTVEDTGRKVYEMLADYQFAELGNDIQHVVNNCTCDGEGFIRLLSFDRYGVMNVVTYSPALDDYDYYASYQDTFSVQLDLIKAERSIKTSDIKVGINLKSVQKADDGADVNFTLYDNGDVGSARYTSKQTFEYTAEADMNDYTVPSQPESGSGYQGYKGVAPTLRYGVSGDYKSLEYLTKVDIMPTSFARSSGSSDYLLTKSDHGINITYSADSSSWTALRGTVSTNADLGKYNRLYFSVTPSDKSAKWNILIYIDGKEIGLSQMLYQNFGYDETNIPSDITGIWSGYIDLSQYLKDNSKITAVAFVAAYEKYDYAFDYLFLASADESDMLTCVVDSERTFAVTGKKGEKFTTDTIPYKAGYVFKGWFTDAECTSAATFPAVGTVYAGYDEADVKTINVYHNDEVDLIGEIKNVSPLGTAIYTVIASIFAIAVIAAASILVIKFKNKSKEEKSK